MQPNGLLKYFNCFCLLNTMLQSHLPILNFLPICILCPRKTIFIAQTVINNFLLIPNVIALEAPPYPFRTSCSLMSKSSCVTSLQKRGQLSKNAHGFEMKNICPRFVMVTCIKNISRFFQIPTICHCVGELMEQQLSTVETSVFGQSLPA